MSLTSINAQQFAQRLEQTPSPFCLDLRTPAEFRTSKLARSINLPLDQCTELALEQLECPNDQPVYLLCASGKRAQIAQQRLQQQSRPLICVEGGLGACAEAGIELEQKAGVISLERQVRIAAGTLVLTGVAIGSLLHPAGFALSGFVGAGLVFAGITDTCGMALLLARMPWNR